jgi:hypothetical protein
MEGTSKKPVLDKPLADLKETSGAEKGTLLLRLDSASSPSSPEGYTLEIKNGYVTINSKGTGRTILRSANFITVAGRCKRSEHQHSRL